MKHVILILCAVSFYHAQADVLVEINGHYKAFTEQEAIDNMKRDIADGMKFSSFAQALATPISPPLPSFTQKWQERSGVDLPSH